MGGQVELAAPGGGVGAGEAEGTHQGAAAGRAGGVGQADGLKEREMKRIQEALRGCASSPAQDPGAHGEDLQHHSPQNLQQREDHQQGRDTPKWGGDPAQLAAAPGPWQSSERIHGALLLPESADQRAAPTQHGEVQARQDLIKILLCLDSCN